jgi:Ca2+-binding RTX toxin-like protein
MSRSRWLTRAGLALFTSTAAVGTLAAPAQAASTGVASVSGAKVVFKAGSNKTNKVVITRSGRTVTIDDAVALKPGKGCKKVDKTKVRCTTATNPARVTVSLGTRNDSVVNKSDLPISAYGGGGNDKLTGGPRNDLLDGGDGADRIWGLGGNDKLRGRYGNDALSGGVGDDILDGGSGNDREYGGAGDDEFAQPLDPGKADADLLSGGPGRDLADYSGRRKAITADSDGVQGDDGAKGEHDTLTGVERIWGGAGNDHLYGTPGADELQGGPGSNVISGGAGNDQLLGGSGNDRLTGGAGDDFLDGDTGADVLLGGSGTDTVTYADRSVPVTVDLDGAAGDDGQSGERDTVGSDVENLRGGWGNDRLTGNAAVNRIEGEWGDDTVHGGAGNDLIDGNKGHDHLYGDAGDDYLDSYYYFGGTDGADQLDGGTGGGDNCVAYEADGDTAVNCELESPVEDPFFY